MRALIVLADKKLRSVSCGDQGLSSSVCKWLSVDLLGREASRVAIHGVDINSKEVDVIELRHAIELLRHR